MRGLKPQILQNVRPSIFNQNWELSSKLLLNLFLKNPSNVLVRYLSSNNDVHEKQLVEAGVEKKELKSSLKQLNKLKVIKIQKRLIKLNPDWKKIVHLPENFEFSYFL